MLPYKDLLAKAIEWLLKTIAPTLLATLLVSESQLSQLLDTAPSLWRFRFLALLLSLCIGLLAFIYLKRQKLTEYRGAFFKPKSGGGYHEVVYCGSCKTPTAIDSRAQFLDLQFKCKCGWVSSFNLGEFNGFIKTIP